jgi:DNA-binding NarL/FixJ family response regulator
VSCTVDSSRFLAAVRGLLERHGMVVVGAASTKAQALHLAEKLRPDVTLRRDLCVELAAK